MVPVPLESSIVAPFGACSITLNVSLGSLTLSSTIPIEIVFLVSPGSNVTVPWGILTSLKSAVPDEKR